MHLRSLPTLSTVTLTTWRITWTFWQISHGFHEQKLIFEWSDFEDIAKKDLDDVNSMSAWLSKHSGDYPLLNYLFQIFIVLPTSTSDVERGFSKMNAIKTALRNRLGSVLIHLLGLCISHALRRFQDLEIQKSLRAHDVSAMILQRNCLEKWTFLYLP